MPDGKIHRSEQPKAPDYAQIRKAVEGIVQQVPYMTRITYEGLVYNRGTAYVNEEGIIRRMPFNRTASLLWRANARAAKAFGTRVNEMQLYGPVIFWAKQPPGSVAK